MTLIDKAEALAPCPFCGGEAIRVDVGLSEFVDGEVTCEDCGGNVGNHPTKAEAIAAWNRRAALPARGVGAKPCGGCGNDDPQKRCIGCLHDFGTPDSAWVHNCALAPTDAAQAPFRMEDMTLADLMRDPLYEAATTPTPTTAQARDDLASAAPERIAIRYDGYEQSIQWDAGWHLPEGREDEVTYRREAPAAQAREAALREAAAAWEAFKAATTSADHFAAVERLDAVLIGEART